MTTETAEFGVFCPGVLEVLSIGKGDLKITIDTEDDREKARVIIQEMLRLGYSIYVETQWGPIRVREFDATSMVYVVDIPDEPVVTEAAGAARPVKAAAKRASKPRRERVPVAGSRATAVGRTSGG